MTVGKKEPITPGMVAQLEATPENTHLGGGLYWCPATDPLCRAVKRLFRFLMRTAHRLGEIVEHPSGEICYLTRESLSWCIGGLTVADPTPEQLAMLREGDFARVAPPRSKTDAFGEIHCLFPSVLPYAPHATNAARMLRDIELEEPCHGFDRASRPLFADARGAPFSHDSMSRMLKALLTKTFGLAIASVITWHSWRIWLASALRASGCPDPMIQLICRWTSEQSLRDYGRLGTSQSIRWCDAAEKAVVDAMTTANIPTISNEAMFAELQQFANHPRAKSIEALAEAADGAVSTPAAGRSPRKPRRQAASPDETLPDGLPTPARDTRPLTLASAKGRCVLVPAHIWPQYACIEQGGQGWLAKVTAVHREDNAVTVRFLYARRTNGKEYDPERLQLALLEPF